MFDDFITFTIDHITMHMRFLVLVIRGSDNIKQQCNIEMKPLYNLSKCKLTKVKWILTVN